MTKSTIQIYGEVVPMQDSEVSYYGAVNLSSVNSQLENASPEDGFLNVNIHTPGGDCSEGFAVYYALRRYAKDNNCKIRTRIDGRCASIGTVIFLAGDERIGNELLEPFIHNAQSGGFGDAQDVQKVADNLVAWNMRIAEHYASHTNKDADYFLEAMSAETFISPEECVEIKFCTSIEEVLRPVARQNLSNYKNVNTMSKNTKKGNDPTLANSLFSSISNAINSVLGQTGDEDPGTGGGAEPGAGAGNDPNTDPGEEDATNLELHTATGDLISFPDLQVGEDPGEGDTATINGEPANGEILMRNADLLTFTKGKLEKLVPGVEAYQNLLSQNETMAEELQTAQSTLQDQVNEVKNIKKDLIKLKSLTGDFTHDGTTNVQTEDNRRTDSRTAGMKARIAEARAKKA